MVKKGLFKTGIEDILSIKIKKSYLPTLNRSLLVELKETLILLNSLSGTKTCWVFKSIQGEGGGQKGPPFWLLILTLLNTLV